jgi:flagellar M-ring protein FliF
MGFDKNDIMRGAELGVLAIVAILIMLMVVRPLLRTAGGGMQMLGGPAGAARLTTNADGQQMQLSGGPGQTLALPNPGGAELDHKIDIARIEGQVKASSVKRVSEFVESHPEESVSIIRSWLHETA